MPKLPQAKLENTVVQDLQNELLVYNLTTHKAYTLNETLKVIFESCDGEKSFDDLKREYKFTDDLIYFGLDKLNANDLLADYQSNHFAGLSRRDVIKKVGLVSMVALPVIAGIVAPTASMAASTTAAVGCVAPNAGGAAGGSNTITSPSGDVAALKRSCQSCCYRDFNGPAPNTGICCNDCADARCQ